MVQANYTLKLTLKQAVAVRKSLENSHKALERQLEGSRPGEDQALRDEYIEIEQLLRDL
jgi:hypothetical protein